MIAKGSAPTFVLSGGGNLGALQVGMLHALVESGVQPEMIVGTSVGAINGAFLASHPGMSGILEIISFRSSLRRGDVLEIRASALIGGLLSHRGYLFDSNPMRRVFASFVSFTRLEDAPVRLAVVATDLATSAPAVLETGDVMTALLASCAIPRILPPVEIDSKVLADGAALADVPLREAILLGARNPYMLPTAPLQVERLHGRIDTWSAGEERDVSIRIVTPPRVHIPTGRPSSVASIDRAWLFAREKLDVGGIPVGIDRDSERERSYSLRWQWLSRSRLVSLARIILR